MNLNVKKGFTLVELLIVVAVIAILASLILANYFEARKQARDERRVIDIEQLQLALRLYVEQYGQQIDCEGGVIFDGVSSNTRIDTKSVNTCVDATNILNFIAKNMKIYHKILLVQAVMITIIILIIITRVMELLSQ